MRKIAVYSTAMVLVVAGVVIWNETRPITRRAQAVPESVTMSPYELHLRIDPNNLPVQEIIDPI
jgi:hypothetical protein